ncbi:glycoside hydrolase family 16 protein [Lentisphaerota bacterium WC36G]|nr:glycoside hydrolase family 16 protein [Lentisphaerae bacterium WC36]
MKKSNKFYCSLMATVITTVLSSGCVSECGKKLNNKPLGIIKASAYGEKKLVQQSPIKNNWQLIWSDEFEDINGDGSLDSSKWGYEVGFIRNKESQYYTKDRRNNVRVEDGKLIIEGIKEDFTAKNGKKSSYTSGSINTLGKFSFKYGRIDVRAKLAGGRGCWPAIWMMGTDRKKYGWPKCGEIDIMEYVVSGKKENPLRVHSTVHGPNYDWKTEKEPRTGYLLFDRPPTEDYHVYSLEWNQDSMKFYFDGKMFLSLKNTQNKEWVYSKPYYILLNLALGGSWGGEIVNDDLPAKYYVDYVRVYEKLAK